MPVISGEKKSDGNRGNSLKNKKAIFVIALICAGAGLFYFLKQENLYLSFFSIKTDGEQAEISLPEAPDREPDIVGMINSVNGNTVMVLKFDPSDIPDVPMISNKSSSKKSTSNGNAISLGTSSGSMLGVGGPGMGMPGSQSSSSRSSSGSSSKSSSSSSGGQFDSSSSNRDTIMSEIKAVSKGKETIEIPIGIAILKDISSGVDGETQQENASFADITSDTMVKIWIKKTDDGKVQAEFVDITGKVNMNNSTN